MSHYGKAHSPFETVEGLCLGIITSAASMSSVSFAGDQLSSSRANRGAAGLMDVRTERVMKKDSYRIGSRLESPYCLYTTALVNARLNFPKQGLSVDRKIRRFLAGCRVQDDGVEVHQTGYDISMLRHHEHLGVQGNGEQRISRYGYLCTHSGQAFHRERLKDGLWPAHYSRGQEMLRRTLRIAPACSTL